MTTLNELVALVADVAGVPAPTRAPAGLAVLDGRRRRARRSARRSASSRRSTAGASTSSRRAARSTSRARARRSATRRASACAKASRRTLDWYRAKHGWTLTRRRTSCSRPASRAARSTPTLVVGRPGLGALLKYELDRHAHAGACRARSGSRCARRCIRCCSDPAGATSSSARTSCCAIRTRFTSATTSSIDDNCLLDAKGEIEPRHPHRRRRVHRPQHDPVVQERRHRARRRREHRLQLRGVLGQPRHDRQAAC